VELSASDWDPVDRQTARYPIEASRIQLSGCATVEYTLTPNNEITDVNVISASHKSFAKEAQKAVTKWNFDSIDSALTSKDVEMQTKFQFCSGDNVSACATAKKTVCKGEGEDVIAVVDYNVDTRDIDERARTYGSPFSALERRFFKAIND
jgi:TonB family protein